MNIPQYIGELLYDYDCVIIPGFGGFITNYAPARIHSKQHLFQPPSKDILFNPQLTRNDGVLAGFIGKKENISYEEAMISIGKFLEEIFSELDQRSTVVFEGIGSISRNSEGLYRFEPGRQVNYLSESYGLPAFTALPVDIRTSVRKPVDAYVIREVMKKAAILLLPVTIAAGMAFVYYNGYKHADSYRADIIGSFKPLSKPIEGFIKGDNEALPLSTIMNNHAGLVLHAWGPGTFEPASISDIPQPAQAITPATANCQPAEDQQLQETSLDNKYIIMVGAFRIRENADNLLADLTRRGYRPRVIDETKNGLTRIGIAGYANMEDAAVALQKLRTGEFPQAWILSR